MGNNAERFPIRDGKQFPSYDFSEMSFDDVKNQLSSIRPEAVGDASTAYKDAADILAKMTTALRTDFAKRIKDNWQGESAQKALDQLGQIYQTAGTLSDKSHNTATTYNWYKVNILDWYKTAAQDMEDGYIHTDGDDENARKFIAKFSRRMGEAYNAHPDTIEKDLPQGEGGLGDRPGGGPGGIPGGGGGGIPGGGGGGGIPGGGGAGMPKLDGAGGAPGGGGFGGENPFSPPTNNGPHLQPGEVNPGASWGSGSGSGAGVGGLGGSPFGGGSGTDLSSFPGGGPGGGGLPGGGGGGLPGGGGGGLPGGGGGGIPGGAPGAFGGVGAGGMGPGGAGAGMGAGGRGAGGAGGARPMGMPMAPGGGGAGQGDQERERETWLTEDEDVWGADDDTAPPVIG